MLNHRTYTAFLLLIAGMGGLLYGYDIGIIGAALLFIGKTISLTLQEESLIVAAVLAGGTLSSLVAGTSADFIGRKKVMIAGAATFIVSVILIVAAHSFWPLFLGRGLQGLSAGMIAVVIPLYLAECLPAAIRGRGTAIFQLMLTAGILISLVVGFYYTRSVQVGGADGESLIRAQDAAWRGMFFSAIYPGIIFLIGVCLAGESPRWLLMRGRVEQAFASLRKARAQPQAESEFTQIRASLQEDRQDHRVGVGFLFQRKYVFPFFITCLVLALTQATGINSILQYIVVILERTGVSAESAAGKATLITGVNFVFTAIGLFLVDRLGRKVLVMAGTAGIAVSLLATALIFRQVESTQVDVRDVLVAEVQDRALTIALDRIATGQDRPVKLIASYEQGGEVRHVTVASDAATPILQIPADPAGGSLTITRAVLAPVPDPSVGNWVMVGLMAFIASYAAGPGICVWLALSELMPTRIRSIGMGVGLLLNQGVSTIIAAVFLPFTSRFGYAPMFLIWAGSSAVYFLVAVFLLPETKGKTLEEIQKLFIKNAPTDPVVRV